MGNRGGPGGRPRDSIQLIMWRKSSIVTPKFNSTNISAKFLKKIVGVKEHFFWAESELRTCSLRVTTLNYFV